MGGEQYGLARRSQHSEIPLRLAVVAHHESIAAAAARPAETVPPFAALATPAARTELADGIVRLSLWYAWHRMQDSCAREYDDSFADAVDVRTCLQGQTDLRGSDWHAARRQLQAVFGRCAGGNDTCQLEEQGTAVVWPAVKRRVAQLGPVVAMPTHLRPFECWSCDREVVPPFSGERLNIHIDNVYTPESPLSERRVEFAASLLRMLLIERARLPEVTTVICDSWLCSVPSFLELFPDEFRASAVPRPELRNGLRGDPVTGGSGWWGQFTSRTGGFHANNAADFRRTGKFPHATVACRADISAIIDVLHQRFPEAVAFNARNGWQG